MNDQYRFDAVIHALPPSAATADCCPIEIQGEIVTTRAVDPTSLSTPFDCTFEEAGEKLEATPRLYFEPDGSFVWTNPGCQVDGILYDRNDRLIYVEVHGNCPAAFFDQFLTILGWPATPLLFQLPRHAVFLDETAFRQFASRRVSG
ncbi:hypothetical protein [Lignipirellula cremea]|uniref:Uncharacterized protein n=1 Tax=Lignipirellula cremea TaxID=2528010 RepID=A0A518DZG0_9BACT|nr:hypothetical protein [Lignipirellula cremea]QDU97212.1 hypothetical protein Pla8534_50570 [Lignipirellula cremea]